MKKIIICLFMMVSLYACTPFDIPNAFIDFRDLKRYQTVTIGTQVWMAENLAYLPSVVGPETGSVDDPYYYVYDYHGTDIDEAKAQTKSTNIYTTYGVLYNWPAAMIACPPGWHLPSDAEWTQLETYLANNGHNYDGTIGGDNIRAKIAISLASATGWLNSTNEGGIGNTNPAYNAYRNKSGFSALPSGYRSFDGRFLHIGDIGRWWSSTEPFERHAWHRYMDNTSSAVHRVELIKLNGYSVRCVKD